MSKKPALIIIVAFILAAVLYLALNRKLIRKSSVGLTDSGNLQNETENVQNSYQPLSIEALRKGMYSGSDVVIEKTLESGSNYSRYYASYKSEGLKIYGLLAVPNGEVPKGGWPAIIFNHGYIPPREYRTTERYVAYLDGFARNGYVVFKPDYRGHDQSEGYPVGAYGSNAYTIDVLNATSSIKKFKGVNPARIGMWGHSLGGFLTLRSMVARKDIKAGVIWSGVVASYPDLLTKWRRRITPFPTFASGGNSWRQLLVKTFGTPERNPEFWNSISANSYLKDISGSLELHAAVTDPSVPVEFSETLADQMKKAGKTVELYTYSEDDHNLAVNFNIAMQRSIEFFDKYLKD